MTNNVLAIGLAVLGFVVAAARAEFKRGHVYVSGNGPKACSSLGGPARIVEINPATGQSTLFTTACPGGGLRFTPDGSRLLMLSGPIVAYDGDANSELYLGGTGVGGGGENGLAFDRHGNLFVKSVGSAIYRIPADGGPVTIFSNQHSGCPTSEGGLGFAPNGDLFLASSAGYSNSIGILRFPPDGQAIPFDDPPGSMRSLDITRDGRLFAVGGTGIIYRYELDYPASRVALTPPFTNQGGPGRALAVSPDGNIVYYADYGGAKVYQIDAHSGVTKLLVDITEFSLPQGMAIYFPVTVGDLDADGDTDTADYLLLDSCATGPGGPVTQHACHFADLDVDGDVDLIDFGVFQADYGNKSAQGR